MTCRRVEDPVFGGSHSFEARVLDAQSGQAVPGAYICVRIPWESEEHGHAGKWEYPGKTGPDGRIVIRALHARRYWIDVIAEGYLRLSATVMAKNEPQPDNERSDIRLNWYADAHWHPSLEGDAEAAQLLMDPSESSSKEIRIERGRVIRGRVQDEQGRPLRDVRVEVVDEFAPWRLPSSPDARSQDDGRFAITVHPGAKFTLRFQAPGRLLESFERKPGDGDEPLALTLQSAASLKGNVEEADGRPATATAVWAVGLRPDARTCRVRADPNGAFAFSSIDPGPVLLAVFDEGRGIAFVQAEAPAVDVRLRLTPPKVLTGTLRDESGRPMGKQFIGQSLRVKSGGVWVEFGFAECRDDSGKNRAGYGFPKLIQAGINADLPTTMTDDEGRFSLEIVSPEGRSVIGAWRPSGQDGQMEHFYALVSAGHPADLVFQSMPYSYARLDLLEEAPETPEEALARAPRSVGESESAERILLDALQRWPEHPGLLERLAQARTTLNDHAGARVILDRWLTLRPRNPSAWLARAHNRWALGDHEAAEAAFSEALFVGEHTSSLFAWRSFFRVMTGNIDGALRDRSEALKAGVDHPSTGLRLADVALRAGDPKSALREVEAWVEEKHFNFWALGLRSRAREAVGDLQGALEDVEKILAAFPGFSLGDKDQAERREELRRRLGLSSTPG